jgi:2',3'-cyclic-nucleotide 2'-phosphodiesterase (5'-nucleotidase family)
MIAQQRAAFSNLLLLDAGDTLFSDRPLTRQSKGALIIEAMNLMGYNAMALGEGDLQLGVGPLQERIAEAKFPILSANVRLTGKDTLFAEPFTIIPIAGHRIGILGLTGMPEEVPRGFAVDDPLEAARRFLPAVTQQADLVIILSHLGWIENARLADLSSDVDLIVGGGSLPMGGQPYRAGMTGTRLTQTERPTVGHAGRYIGQWNIVLKSDGSAVFEGWRMIPLLPDYPDDPAVVDLLGRYSAGP